MLNAPFSAVAEVFRKAAKLLSGHKRRLFQAQVAIEHAQSSPRLAEQRFGWSRKSVQRGLSELLSPVPGSASKAPVATGRGRKRVEAKQPRVLEVVSALLSENTQADPQLKTTKLYTRVTGVSLRQIMAQELGIAVEEIPSPRTMRRVLVRNGYSLKRVRKILPKKKLPETDAIFANVRQAHQRAAQDPSILRISIDCKAKVKLGNFSRGGKTRDQKEIEAADHDMGGESITPCGILEVVSDQLSLSFVSGPCTSDTIADQIDAWWRDRKHLDPQVRKIMIDLDNGPQISSHRSQFMKRMLEFTQKHQIAVELVYYPPYHSKYNPIERCWGVLERHWNGTQLKDLQTVLCWASTMTWRGVAPIVSFVERQYSKGIKLTRAAFRVVEQQLRRSASIGKWSVHLDLPVETSTA